MGDANQTERATPQRRKKAREQGQIARSRELSNMFALFGIGGTLLSLSVDMGAHWRSFYLGTLELATYESITAGGALLYRSFLEVIRWTMPPMLVAFFLSLGASMAQGGLNFAPAALQPKAERLNPQGRLKQIFSSASVGTLGKTIIPFAAILLVGVEGLKQHWAALVRSSEMDLHQFSSVVATIAWTVAWKAGLILLAWCSVDYGLLIRRNEAQLRMSKQELRQEHKENDGNPQTKRQIRRLQRAMRNKRSLKAVPTATLVVTNPTHYAVALRYEAPMAAPEVVAKGRDLLAQKIKDLARDKGIVVMENKPLAQSLYKSVEVGDSIPMQLYQAVAELLVVVFRAQAELREQERARSRRNAAGEVITS